MTDIIQKRIDEWTRSPFDSGTIGEIKSLADGNNHKELEDRFYTQLEFGTGGLRGVIGAGTNRMNIYTVGMATQGLANYILSKNGKDKGVVVARDSRLMSVEFARETAAVLAGNGIKVFFFEDIMPVPLGSFAIRELNTIAGVIITASHNPPEYNGYKVYWEDGGQIIYPQDNEIIDEVKKVDSIEKIDKTDFDSGVKTGLITIIGDAVVESYIHNLEQKVLTPVSERPEKEVKIVYTPIHGTGYKIIPKIMSHFGFKNIFINEKQAVPDGNFPTVKSPNPEEKETLTLALEMAREIDPDIVMATDPDSDRMGIAFKDKKGEYMLINGNQIGTMLEYYVLTRMKERGTLPGNAAVIKTIVTTELQREIAESFDCNIMDVLTGFKWIAAKMGEFDQTGDNTFIFGGEESYGYLPIDFVRDKDAVSSCYFFAEMTDWLFNKGQTLGDFLDEIYCRYHLYLEDLHSLTLKGVEGKEHIKTIMKEFRSSPPKEFIGIPVLSTVDYDSPESKLPASNVLQFFLEDGSKITMRPSGTEPKIKFYFSIKEKVSKENIEEKKKELHSRLEDLKKDLLQKVGEV
ncbi:MAG: phospho-sugar mutase [bacterium]|nr:phospho-sugar mutase [bacterium]